MAAYALLLAALPAAVPASELFEKSTPVFRVFAGPEGLAPTPAQALAFDAQGHLWVGTQSGLAQGDGRAFHPVLLPGEGTSQIVRAILPASDGSIWVGTSGSGVFRLRAGTWSHPETGLPSPDVQALIEAQGAVW